MRFILFLLFLFMIPVSAAAQSQADPEAASGIQAKPLVTTTNHMVVAAHPLASQAGVDTLAAGGSAADAAIAALLVLNVVEPQSSGIGGGAFALVHGPDGLTSWDARETAPAGATPDLFMEGGAPLPWLEVVPTGLSTGVPGLVRLMEALHARHGKLRWGDLFQRAIELARDGFPVSPRMAGSIETYAGRLSDADAADVFLPDGKPPVEGVIFTQPTLADTLEAIAAQGADAFYLGPIAEQIVATVNEAPRSGSMTLQDLADYKVIERPAVCHPFKTYRVCGMGPPSSGATTIGQILMLLDRFKPADWALDEDRIWHLFAEASRLSYADRAKYLGDEDFVKVPVKGLLDPTYMDQRARLIPPFEASAERATAGEPPWREGRLYAPDLQEDLPGTTHLSIVDSDGLAISLTASIETAFGSGRMAGGFLLNNQLTDFSFRPVAEDGRPIANAVAPGKRPRSSMAPTIVYLDDAPVVLAGSPGGSRIPEYVAQSLLGMLAFGLDPAAAVALPHVSHRNRGGIVVEPEVAATIQQGLAARGHKIEVKPMTSGLHVIEITENGLRGGADPRREGVAIGQ